MRPIEGPGEEESERAKWASSSKGGREKREEQQCRKVEAEADRNFDGSLQLNDQPFDSWLARQILFLRFSNGKE